MRTVTTRISPVDRESARQAMNESQLDRFFAGIGFRMGPAQSGPAHGSSRLPVAKTELKDFFSSVEHVVERAEIQQRLVDKRLATGFNVFHLIEPDENKISDILADLLNPNGTHGQGDLFLRLLFKHLGLAPHAKLIKDATVHREAPTHGIQKFRRRMDVFVEAGALLVIENKLDSLEQVDQVKDYLAHLQHCARGRPASLIYLTPDGRSPDSLCSSVIEQQEADGKLHCWSYQEKLRAWLENCRSECAAQKIRGFLADFIAYIESHLKREVENTDEEKFDEN